MSMEPLFEYLDETFYGIAFTFVLHLRKEKKTAFAGTYVLSGFFSIWQ